MSRLVDLTGRVFGRLTVKKESPRISTNHNRRWLCECSCGKTTIVTGCHLVTLHTQSCGCLKIETTIARSTIHGHAPSWGHGKRSKTHRIWTQMRNRCHSAWHPDFPQYGACGISVCDRWFNSFEAFLEDMGECPGSEYSIDRYPNNKGNYEPGNCRWATMRQQSRNRRTNHLVSINGETHCIAEWLEHFGIKKLTYYSRVRYGWSVVKALTTPVKIQR